MGGATKKFACTTSTGKVIRVKYTEPSKTSNREVFATVAASRLLWALGFTSHPVYPIALDCLNCPDDPTEGTGKKEKRSYLATYSPMFTDPALVDEDEADQGWKFGELDAAVKALPAGELRSRQLQHYEALQLVGVLLQHGDRKPEQQRLSCHSALKAGAGSVREVKGSAAFVENPGATACDSPVVSFQDLGATFGGAGKRTKGSTAKMNLDEWTDKQVFKRSGSGTECHGDLTVSIAAGDGSMGDPRIGEAGRKFLRGSSAASDRRPPESHLRRGTRQSDDQGRRRPPGLHGRGMGRGVQGQGPADRRAHLRAVAVRHAPPARLQRPLPTSRAQPPPTL